MTDYRVLNAATASMLGGMTFPSYRHLLSLQPNVRHLHENDPREIQPLAIGAVEENVLVGLAVVELPLHDRKPPEILSLFVDPQHRRRGIGRGLTNAVAEEVARRGFDSLDAVYMTGKPSIEYVEKIFAALAWQALWVLLFVRMGATLFRRRVMKSGPQQPRARRWGRARAAT